MNIILSDEATLPQTMPEAGSSDIALLDAGRRTWQWIDARLSLFSPWRGNDLSMEGLQALAELCLVFERLTTGTRIWDRLCDDDAAEERWRIHLHTQVSAPAMAELARKRPVQAFPYLLPYLVLRSTGFREPFYERTMELLAAWGFPEAQEVVPFRELDVVYFMRKAGFEYSTDMAALYRRTFLARMRNPIHIDNDSAYSITHTLLYLSDFGAKELALPLEEVTRAQEVVESLLPHYLRAGHWDLVGELLLCAAIAGSPERTLEPLVRRAFYGAHFEDGTIVGREENGAEVLEARLAGDESRIFTGCYHTTVVSMLLTTRLLEMNQ